MNVDSIFSGARVSEGKRLYEETDRSRSVSIPSERTKDTQLNKIRLILVISGVRGK